MNMNRWKINEGEITLLSDKEKNIFNTNFNFLYKQSIVNRWKSVHLYKNCIFVLRMSAYSF